MKPDLALGLDVVSDVLQNPAFPQSEVDLEKGAQIAAIKAEDEQITAVARNVMREKLFGAHPYALRGSGRPESVGKITPSDLRAFHDQYVVAQNGVIAVFGDVKAEEVLELFEKDFGSMPAGKLALSEPPKPVGPASPVSAVEERNKQQAVVMIGYPGADVLDPDRVSLDLLNEASNDLGSRFFNRIREQLGLAYFVGAGNFLGLAPGSFVFYLGTDPKKVGAVSTEFQQEIDGLSREGLTAEELSRAKKKLLGSEAIRNQSNSAFAASVAVDELVGLGFDNYLRRKKDVEAVTIENIRRVAAKYFNTPSGQSSSDLRRRPPQTTFCLITDYGRSSNLNALGGVVAEVHRIRDDAGPTSLALSRPNSQSALRAIRSAPGARQALYRSTRDDSGKDPGQPHRARDGDPQQRAHGPAHGLCPGVLEFAARRRGRPASPARSAKDLRRSDGRFGGGFGKQKKILEKLRLLARRGALPEGLAAVADRSSLFLAWKRPFAHPATDCQK